MSHYGKAVLLAGPAIIYSYFAWIYKYAKHPEKYDFSKRYQKTRKLLIRLSNSFNVEFHIEGKENIPEEASCFISNHLSAYDPITLICALDKPATFVGKIELEKAPFAGKVMKGLDCQFIDRNDLKQSLRVMMKVEEDLKKNHQRSWIIYPEGTRNKDAMHNIKEFHHGTFRPAVKAKVPIVPVATFGTFRALKSKPNFKRYPIFIKFLKPIYPEEYEKMTTKEIAIKVQNMIEQAVDYDLRIKDHQEMKKIGNKNYRYNQVL